ncbi:MAG: SocA family protein [Symploca sp. SIO2E6]|nr:SocA family protein [Symploca sp. SIO2E6]
MLKQLIKYFVYQTKGHITKTQLIKFLYLADLYAVKWTEKQLTELDWYYYHYGPWHEDIDTALKQMDGQEIAQELQENTTFIKLGVAANTTEDIGIPLGLELMLDNIRREWAGTGSAKLQQLGEYVHNTAPMLKVKENNQPEAKVKLNLIAEREKLVSELGL